MDYLKPDIATPDELEYFTHIALEDLLTTIHKNAEYGASWKKRGGQGAFMMLARKWDRLEEMCKREGYDIFSAIKKSSSSSEALIDTIADLRNYLTLVQNEAIKTGLIEKPKKYLKYNTSEAGDPFLVSHPISLGDLKPVNFPRPFGYDPAENDPEQPNETWEQRLKRLSENGKHP